MCNAVSTTLLLSDRHYELLNPFPVQVFDAASGDGTAGIDFFQDPRPSGLTLEVIEKWWCIGDLRNRKGLWIQGRSMSSSTGHYK